MKDYLLQVLIAVDQVVNTLLGGWADETLSSRAYRLSPESVYWRWTGGLIDLLFFFDKDHCLKAYESEWNRRHFPPSLRHPIDAYRN